jgi:hypothetical protein
MIIKKPIKTTEIKDSMTWWLTKRRAFVVGDFEITLVDINKEDGCAKILIKNIKTGEVNEQDAT